MKELLKAAAIAGAGTLLASGFAFAAVGNDHTGYDSDNDASIERETDTELDVDNDASIHNAIDGMLKTGYNKSSYNTGSGEVDSGDADATVVVANMANQSSVEVACDTCGGGTDLPSVTNSTTGANSHNDAWVKIENDLEIDVDNDANVCNDINVWTSTGGNASSYNTGNGSVSTGDASLHVDLSNTLNTSEVMVQ